MGKWSNCGRFTIDEDAFALPAIFNEQPGIIQKNGDAFARNAHVVERQVITVFLAPSNKEWKGGDGNYLSWKIKEDDFEICVAWSNRFGHR